MLQEVIAKISAQQEKLGKDKPAYWVGEQLKDILRESPDCAELVLNDLDTEGMEIADCEKKIAAYAKAHRSGSCGVCPPQEADKIIREFYGLPGRTITRETAPEQTQESTVSGMLSLDDFL